MLPLCYYHSCVVWTIGKLNKKVAILFHLPMVWFSNRQILTVNIFEQDVSGCHINLAANRSSSKTIGDVMTKFGRRGNPDIALQSLKVARNR